MNYSVLMSVYEKEDPSFLETAIKSMIEQTVPPSEFVLVCDGVLTPELDRVIETFGHKLKVVRMPKRGLPFALNSGLAVCENEIIARMDSDDISKRDRCEKELKLIENCDIVGAAIAEFTDVPDDVDRGRAVPETDDEIRRFARRRNPFNHPTVMYRKSKVIAAGGYEDYLYCEDYHLFAKMLLANCKGANCQEVLLDMRTSDQLYIRRSGVNYFKALYRLRKYLLKNGFCGKIDFVFCVIFNFVSACLFPNRLRKMLYVNLLRKGKR